MATKTRKEYERSKVKDEPVEKKKIQKQEAGEHPLPVSIDQVPSKTIPKKFVIQDPESRTFKDSIVLAGRKVERIVERGKIETKDEALKNFLVGKGWILLDTITEEVLNG